MVADYKINLIHIRELQDTSVFKTDVKQVFDFIRCANDKNALKELVEQDSYYQNMEETAFDVAMQYTKATELIQVKQEYGKDGTVNMCKALTELIQDGRQEGRQEGRYEGIFLAKKVYKLHQIGKDENEIAEECKISLEEVEEILE